eukprot:scaffold62934_cov76-Attheya_sp.AAC.1
MKHTWQFLNFYNIVVEDDVPKIHLCRTNDCFLLKAFLDHGFRGKDLQVLNECRLYLAVSTLADICSGDGTYILPHMTLGARDPRQAVRYNSWPRSVLPNKSACTLWLQALSATFAIPFPDPILRLQIPLGAWTDETHISWFFSPSTQLVWQRTGTVWHTYRAKNGRCSARLSQRHFTKQTSLTHELSSTAPTSDAAPTIVYSTRNKAIIVCTGIHVATSPPQSPVITPSAIPRRTLAELLAGGQRNRRWATRNVRIHDNGENVAQSIREGTARAVSDGSYINGLGAAGYVLLGTSHRSRITGSLVLPGSSLDMSAYRSELGGLYGIICVVEDVCIIHTIKSGHSHHYRM